CHTDLEGGITIDHIPSTMRGPFCMKAVSELYQKNVGTFHVRVNEESYEMVLGVRQGVQEGIRYYLPTCELPENDEVRHIVDGIGKLVGMDCKFDRFLASTRCHDSSLELGVPGGHVWLAVLRVSDDSLLGDALNSGEPKQEPCYFDWIEAVELARRSGVRPDGVAWRLYTLIQDYAVHGVGGLNMELRYDLTNSKAQIVFC
ncbi:hypothetical protein FOZ63_000829, partial [Perkinsus olseni]